MKTLLAGLRVAFGWALVVTVLAVAMAFYGVGMLLLWVGGKLGARRP